MFKKKDKIDQVALPLTQCLAKTYKTSEGEKKAGREVLNHCHIVGEVARELRERLANHLVDEFFPPGVELVAACHDIGKVSPTFQEKIYRGTDGYQKNSKPELKQANPDTEAAWGGHAGASQAAAVELKLGKYIPDIIGQHHGFSPNHNHLATDEVFGGNAWQQRRKELVESLKHALETDFSNVQNELQARVLAGYTTVSDWIGSGPLFEVPGQAWQEKIKQALDDAGFIKPRYKTGLSFENIFSWSMRETQQKFVEQVTQPGVYILEAPMGLGKTEAALYAAYQLMSSGQAAGLYFALPTQLTSDKIHQRVVAFLQQILANESAHQKPLLLHSNAWLKETIMGEEGSPGGSWFQASKRGTLAPFAVGTIDQALMAVMNVKHGFVRTFGLMGKVVILDEVHSYDSYTGTLLDALVKSLRDLQCTVIILSATLTRERRMALLGIKNDESLSHGDYPLISGVRKDKQLIKTVPQEISGHDITIQLCKRDEQAIEDALLRAEQGQQVLWIENTVDEAQDIYRQLSARECVPKIECGLLHSRFMKMDREIKENYWTDVYGKGESSDIKRSQNGRILVGTQILEQSLDIDADFLVTRFAPSDMLLQRLGRLWRHKRKNRNQHAKREVCLLIPELSDAVANPQSAFGKTAKIYSPYVLCRSLEVWNNCCRINLPGDIRKTMEATYADREEVTPLLNYLNELNKKREELQGLAQIGLSTAGKTLPEEKASTRYSEQDRVEVLLIKNYHTDSKNSGVIIELLNGEKISLPGKGTRPSPQQRRAIATKLLQNTVLIAEYLAPKAPDLSGLSWLQDYLHVSSDQGLRLIKVLESGSIVSLHGTTACDKYKLHYNAQLGYWAER